MKLALRVHPSQDRAHDELEGWEIAGGYIPDSLEIHFEVVMNEHVPHTGNRLPVNFGMRVFMSCIDPAHRFAEDLKPCE